jgi:hypothetical protein
MLSREDIDNLPDDEDEAFALLSDLFEAYVEERSAQRNGMQHADAVGCAEEVQAVVTAWDGEEKYRRLMRNPAPGDGEWFEWWTDFQGTMRHYKVRALMLRRKSLMSVVLDKSHRAKIRALLNRVRGIVPNLKVSVAKHEKILDLISKLENEVDRPRTRMEAFFALVLEGSSVMRQVGEDAKPLIEDIEKINGLFSEAKDDDLSPPSLPPPTPKPRIEDKRPKSRGGMDDDIPF